MEKRALVLGMFIAAVLLVLYVFMLWSSRHPLIVDDVYPGSSCDGLLKKADILYVIPNFEHHLIQDDPEWCAKIRSLNTTLGLHGITHLYPEFDGEINEEDLLSAIHSFETCFREKPRLFRPPYNLINTKNEEIVSRMDMAVYDKRFIIHPYCHCDPKFLMKVLNVILWC